ncbi:MAG: MBL fold metallo-hydrolase [Patescibacteria group bacterium]|nr:MBL fold metallo-hydrolase [Patescibacteria group bacterium]
MQKQSTIYFYGGAGSVTGSNFLLALSEVEGFDSEFKILIDCGLQQGEHTCQDSNWNPFLFEPKDIPFLIVTHAHIDHIGRIPLLVKRGFKGRIISTEATKAVSEPLLLDSMELLGREAERCGNDILYTEADIAAAMALWEDITYHQPVPLEGGVTLELLNSGHILGSAMAKFTRGGKSIVFTGDIGGGNSPLLKEAEPLRGVDYLVMESVYGNRIQPQKDHRREALEDVVEDTARRGGTLLIPAFSNERTQDLLFEVRTLMVEKRVPSMPVYVDSPLAEKITESFVKFPQYFADDIRKRVEGGERIFNFAELRYVSDVEASRKADQAPSPKIIIAGSGMSNGGRVREHEMHVLLDPKSTLLIVGYQAAGSLGRRLVEGLKTAYIGKEKVPVKCKVEAIYAYSAHMDGEQLVEFVNQAADSLKEVFVVMGEPAASSTLVQRIRDYLGVKALAPEAGEKQMIEF